MAEIADSLRNTLSATATVSRLRPVLMRRNLMLYAIAASLCAAAALFFAPKHYRAWQTFGLPPAPTGEVAGDAAAPRPDDFRQNLLDVAWDRCSGPRTGQSRSRRWEVTASKSDGFLQLAVYGPSPNLAKQALASISDGFRERLAQAAQSRATAEDPVERTLIDQIAALDSQIQGLNQPESAADEAPDGSAAGSPDALFSRLSQQNGELMRCREQFDSVRDRLRTVRAERDQLAQTPVPETAVVEEASRALALAADVALQQDLRHLSVQCAQVRSAMLKVWESSRQALADLAAEAQRLSQVTAWPETEAASTPTRANLERIAQAAGQYHALVRQFADEWDREFEALRDTPLEALTQDLLGTYDRAISRSNEFGQSATSAASSLRLRVVAATELPDADARRQLLDGELTRSLRALTSARQRFDASAGDLTSRDNYVLEAALQSARGLSRRIRSARETIEQRLEDDARRRARTQQEQRLADLNSRIEVQQRELDLAADAVTAAQNACLKLWRAVPADVRFAMAVDATDSRRDWLLNERTLLCRRLAESREHRAPASESPEVLAGPAGVSRVPANLAGVLATAALAWSLSFLALLGAQRVWGAPTRVDPRSIDGSISDRR